MNQSMDLVPFGETLHQTLPVLPHPARNVVGHPDVERSIRLARENVNVILTAHGTTDGFPLSRE
jgi:hypothetical protein